MPPSELPLICAEDSKGPPPPWDYNLTCVSLVEQLGNTHYVYGMWGKLYGFWEVDPTNNISREFVPTWRLFDDNGIWLSQAETRDLRISYFRNSLASHWLFEADAAFAALFSEIPRQIRSLVAPMGQHQGIALDLIWHEPGLVPLIDEELHKGTEQHFLSYLALSKAEFLSRTERKELAMEILRNEKIPHYQL
jgi:hypothetical protein